MLLTIMTSYFTKQHFLLIIFHLSIILYWIVVSCLHFNTNLNGWKSYVKINKYLLELFCYLLFCDKVVCGLDDGLVV